MYIGIQPQFFLWIRVHNEESLQTTCLKTRKLKFLSIAYETLCDLATIHLFRSCHSSFALHTLARLNCLQSFFFISSCFTLLQLYSCISITWENPLYPSNSTFKTMFRQQLLCKEFLGSPPSPQTKSFFSGSNSTICIASLYLFTCYIIVFKYLFPQLNWKFFQGRDCVVFIFIILVPSLEPDPQ